MKHVLFATTALVALAGVTSAAADVSITGHTRFTYDDGVKKDKSKMNPDYNIWIKADDASDTGLRYGGAVRITPDDGEETGSRHYLWIENELGKVTFGQHTGPADTMSVGASWRGTVAAAGKTHGTAIQGHTTPRVIYMSPNIGGFQFGTSVSQGTDSLGAESQTGLNYSIPFNDTMIKFGHSFSSAAGTSATDLKRKGRETGIEIKHGGFTASATWFSKGVTVVTEATTKPTPPRVLDVSNCGAISNNHPKTGVREIHTLFTISDGSTKYGTCPHADYYDPPLTENLDSDGNYDGKTVLQALPPTEVPAFGTSHKTSGQEYEIAYAFNEDLTVNAVLFKTDVVDKNNNKGSYDRTSVGVKYTVAPGLTASLSNSWIDNAGQDENAAVFRLNYSF